MGRGSADFEWFGNAPCSPESLVGDELRLRRKDIDRYCPRMRKYRACVSRMLVMANPLRGRRCNWFILTLTACFSTFIQIRIESKHTICNTYSHTTWQVGSDPYAQSQKCFARLARPDSSRIDQSYVNTVAIISLITRTLPMLNSLIYYSVVLGIVIEET